MKRLITFQFIAALVIACNHAGPTASTYVGSDKEMPKKQLEAAENRWPGTTREQLDSGAIIFKTKCLQCHGNYALTLFTEERWKYELSRMSKVAKLTPEEEIQVTRFVISLRDAEISLQH